MRRLRNRLVCAAGDGDCGGLLGRRQAPSPSPTADAADAGRRRSGRRRGRTSARWPSRPIPPTVYVAKVKNLLVGLPPTGDEVAAVTADPTQLKPLVQGWMQLPQYAAKMQRFFELAFQQTQVTSADYADQVYPKQIDDNATTTPLLLQNLEESFARTMLALIAAGQPLTAATTTNQLMMTTALKELYAFLDVWEVDDSSTVTDRFKKANPKLQITVETAGGPDPDRRDARSRPAPTTCTGTTPTPPRRIRRSPAARWIRSSTRRARSRCTGCSTATLDGRKLGRRHQLSPTRRQRDGGRSSRPATSPTGRW